jgi:hypothetical protein
VVNHAIDPGTAHRHGRRLFVKLIDALGVADALERVGRTAPQPVAPTSPTRAATLERYVATRPSLDTANKYRIIARRTINPVLVMSLSPS